MDSIYCVKCRVRRDVQAEQGPIKWVDKKTGQEKQRHGLHATCPVCSTKIRKFKSNNGGSAPAPNSSNAATSKTVPGVTGATTPSDVKL